MGEKRTMAPTGPTLVASPTTVPTVLPATSAPTPPVTTYDTRKLKTGRGGAVYVEFSSVNLTNVTFNNNNATLGDALYLFLPTCARQSSSQAQSLLFIILSAHEPTRRCVFSCMYIRRVGTP